MQSVGVQGLLSVTPYYNKPTPEGLYQHFSAIAEATPLPIVLYNVPGRTGCNIDAATLARLATIPHVIGVKEASGNIPQMVEICRAVPADFLVLSGDDALTLPLMAIGGRGVDLGGVERDPRRDVADGGSRRARRLSRRRAQMHQRLVPLMLGNFIESNPGPGQVRDGGDGPVRRGLPAADGVAAAGLAGEDHRVPEGARRLTGAAGVAMLESAVHHRGAGRRRRRRRQGARRARRSTS